MHTFQCVSILVHVGFRVQVYCVQYMVHKSCCGKTIKISLAANALKSFTSLQSENFIFLHLVYLNVQTLVTVTRSTNRTYTRAHAVTHENHTWMTFPIGCTLIINVLGNKFPKFCETHTRVPFGVKFFHYRQK